MKQLIGVPFLVMAVVFTLCVVYCVWMGLVANAGWFLVGLGVLFSDILVYRIAWELLKP